MFTLESQHPTPRLRRALLPWLLAVGIPMALSACDGANDPVAPPEDPPGPATQPAPSEAVASGETLALATGQRIAFMSYGGGSYPDLYKIDPQGSSLVHLASSAENETSPAWSYDNKRLALVRRRASGGIYRDDIYLINADGSNGHWALANPIAYPLQDPSWSPDGSRLVLRVWVQNISYLGRIDLATRQLSFILNESSAGIPGRQPSYDATGKKILYLGNAGKTIEQINADGTGHKTRFTSATTVDFPTFSPDGKKIAFNRPVGTGNNVEIYVKNYVDGSLTRLTTYAGGDRHPTWSPDGTRIAFESTRSGKAQIWTMNATTGGNLVRVTHTTRDESNPAWSH